MIRSFTTDRTGTLMNHQAAANALELFGTFLLCGFLIFIVVLIGMFVKFEVERHRENRIRNTRYENPVLKGVKRTLKD